MRKLCLLKLVLVPALNGTYWMYQGLHTRRAKSYMTDQCMQKVCELKGLP